MMGSRSQSQQILFARCLGGKGDLWIQGTLGTLKRRFHQNSTAKEKTYENTFCGTAHIFQVNIDEAWPFIVGP